MKKITIALASAATLALAACGGTTDETYADDAAMADQSTNTDMATPGTIVEVAQGNDDFSTLVSAVTAAKLGDTLSGEGPYTVFAPTNEAFAKLPDGTVEDLTTNNTDKLASILTYHVVQGKTDAATLTTAIEGAGDAGYELTTVNGGKLTAKLDGGNVVLTDAAGNTATVTSTDVDASNGVIHVIDTVLMPE